MKILLLLMIQNRLRDNLLKKLNLGDSGKYNCEIGKIMVTHMSNNMQNMFICRTEKVIVGTSGIFGDKISNSMYHSCADTFLMS